MSTQTANEISEGLRLLIPSDPAGVIVTARKALKDAKDDYERAAAAGVLVDAGEAAGDVTASTTGLVAIQRLVKKQPSDGNLRYMLGTAYSTIALLDKTPRPEWWEATRKLQIDQRRELWRAADSGIEAQNKAQAWINLGNNLERCGRWIEAFTAFMEALEVSPSHPVAAGWAACMLLRRGGAPGGPDWVPTAHHLAGIAKSNLEYAERIAPGSEKFFERLPTDRADEFVASKLSAFDTLDGFIVKYRLHLSMSLDPSHPDCWDSLSTPRLREAIDTPPEPPSLFAMFNTCKADYLLARKLAWDARNTDDDDVHHYTNTLDYAQYGLKSSLEILAMRSSFDLLDRIAVAANHYFGLGVEAKNVYFKSLWRQHVPGEPLLPGVESEIDAKNWGMLALVSLSDDFRDDGWLFGRQRFRNIATHRFLVSHWMMSGGWRDTPEIEHISQGDLEEITISALRIARSALLYLADAVSRREHRLHSSEGPSFELTLPRLGQ